MRCPICGSSIRENESICSKCKHVYASDEIVLGEVTREEEDNLIKEKEAWKRKEQKRKETERRRTIEREERERRSTETRDKYLQE